MRLWQVMGFAMSVVFLGIIVGSSNLLGPSLRPSVGIADTSIPLPPEEAKRIKEIESLARDLASPVTATRLAAESRLDAEMEPALEDLMSMLGRGREHTQRAVAAALTLISPWQRGVARGRNHHGQIELFSVYRPTGRSVGHPRAAELRDAASETLIRLLNDRHKLKGEVRWELSSEVRDLCGLLAEVGDASTADQVAALLDQTSDLDFGPHLLTCLEMIHGLPPAFMRCGICGNSTPEEIADFERGQKEAFELACRQRLQWHNDNRGRPSDDRMAAVLKIWNAKLRAEQHSLYSLDYEPATQHYLTPVVRLGLPAVPHIRTIQSQADSLYLQGMWEVVAAAITGELNADLVRELLSDTSPNAMLHQRLAFEIIAAAGSKDWMAELTKSHLRVQGPQFKASYTLAVVHRKDALPVLRQAGEHNYVATCAAAELESWDE